MRKKKAFIEATMPANFKQMLSAFEQLPPDRQRRMLEQTFRQLPPRVGACRGRQRFSAVHPDMLITMRTDGLSNAYSQSSAKHRWNWRRSWRNCSGSCKPAEDFAAGCAGSYGDGRSTNPPPTKGAK